ncbi:ARM repeat-containing protein [Panus rudis PR-1116 ss-1]|nr:ARM repeat-containing protein [Panus rudis PR-1116 ss-1]
MPRENRKRGKKHKKKPNGEPAVLEVDIQQSQEQEAGPSWITRATHSQDVNSEAPFGYVDAEVKAYFRTVDIQIRDWQESEKPAADQTEDVDPNEDRRLFFVAALTEMSGKEKQLATDPDCSNILERMLYSMDDFARRVFFDRLSGSFEQLIRHRFASHVCQTLFVVSTDTVARESRGIFPSIPESSEQGELRTLTQLILDACDELLPSLPSLAMDPFASHVLRAILCLLCPKLFSLQEISSKSSLVRSKKSAAYKAKQGPMKSVFSQDDSISRQVTKAPKQFWGVLEQFISTFRERQDDNEVRALAANQVASPVLQMMLELEAEMKTADESGSLMDRVLHGLITTIHADPNAKPEASGYVATLLRDPTSSHIFETLVSRSPEAVFDVLWSMYFEKKLGRLAVHPVANFVVAKAIARLNTKQLANAFGEISDVAVKILKASRTGVLCALADRAASLQKHEEFVLQTIYTAFEMSEDDDRVLLVPCVLTLSTVAGYKHDLARRAQKTSQKEEDQSRKDLAINSPLEPKTAGAILLQALLRLPAPHNEPVLESVFALNVDELLSMAYNATSSRVFDALLDSPTVAAKHKRKFILGFIGHYHLLVDDRIGSRVGDRCWAYADPYLREKIARSLIRHEHTMAGSFYGKFFARNLNLHLLQRNVEEWKNVQAKAKLESQQQKQHKQSKKLSNNVPISDHSRTESPIPQPDQNKRKRHPEDEIDDLFDSTLGKKIKKADLGDSANPSPPPKTLTDSIAADKSLADIIGAIKAAPKGERSNKRKRAK